MMLNNRIALVVGGGNGLGRAIAKAYAREGAILAVADLDYDAAVETLAQIDQTSKGLAQKVDISDAMVFREVVETVLNRFSRLDIMVNCAAICLVDPLLEVTPERWDKVFAVNARGAFFCIQAAARAMIPKKFGRIITITSPASKMGFPNFASYAASKAAVDSMTRAAAVTLAPYGITVNCIAPGRMTGGMVDAIEKELMKLTSKTEDQLKADRTKDLPMGRRVAPEEVAEAAVWLASDAAAYITAERFNFSGGMELS
ncbi:MAG: SDR family oxidoreductase [Nitrospira sp.]|nr:SDR family oxidoreductase [Nitrospira sp.]